MTAVVAITVQGQNIEAMHDCTGDVYPATPSASLYKNAPPSAVLLVPLVDAALQGNLVVDAAHLTPPSAVLLVPLVDASHSTPGALPSVLYAVKAAGSLLLWAAAYKTTRGGLGTISKTRHHSRSILRGTLSTFQRWCIQQPLMMV